MLLLNKFSQHNLTSTNYLKTLTLDRENNRYTFSSLFK